MKSIALLALTMALMISGAVHGMETIERGDLRSKWQASLRAIDRQLVQGEFESARRGAIKLAKEMVESIGYGGGSAYSLAVVSAFRAIAESGLGNEDDALWYWRTASALDPNIEKTDLSPYGAPAAKLKAIPFRGGIWSGLVRIPGEGTQVQRPVLKKQRPPRYPESMRKLGVQSAYVFEAIIDKEGRLREPSVLTPVKEPAFVYVVLDALKDWEFQPATLHGEPIVVLYTLSVNFDIRE